MRPRRQPSHNSGSGRGASAVAGSRKIATMLKEGAAEHTVGVYTWQRLGSKDGVPPNLAPDGPNLDIPENPEKPLPHGFTTPELNGD